MMERSDESHVESTSKTHQELVLDLNADVAEWCSFSHLSTSEGFSTDCSEARTHILVAGTYQLDEEKNARQGRLYFYQLEGVDREAKGLFGSSPSLKELCTHDLPGVFDIQWLNSKFFKFSNEIANGGDSTTQMLAAALADGSVRIFEFSVLSQNIVEKTSVGPAPHDSDDNMALYISHNRQNNSTTEFNIAASYSNGQVQIFQCTPSDLTPVSSWKAHELETWNVCFDFQDPHLLYSGGDDCAWKCWDTRVKFEDEEESVSGSPIWIDRRSHSAGVCCISCSPWVPNCLCTGSYDDKARLWDLRNPSKPLLSIETNTGGGVWRLKWHPTNPKLLLAACMYGGFLLLQADHGAGTLTTVESYPFQKTLAYGADWCSYVEKDGTSFAATCSFYDRLLHLWSPALKA